MSGIKFGKHTNVQGNVVNIEGDQLNISSAHVKQLHDELTRFLDAVYFGKPEDVYETASTLQLHDQSSLANITESQVRESVETYLKNNGEQKPANFGLLDSLAISATGSAIVSVAIEVIRAIVGG